MRENFGDLTFTDRETQSRLKQDTIDILANLNEERFMRHFNNRSQIDDPDILDAVWQEYAKRKGLR